MIAAAPTGIVPALVHFFAPWQSAYNNSPIIDTGVTSVHLVALLFGGGLAVAADRATLRSLRATAEDRARQLSEIHRIHRPVLVALVFLFVSGVLLAAADVKTFATSPLFWVKLALVALLLVNGAVLTATESALRRTAPVGEEARSHRLWRRLRMSAWCSIGLWTATLVAGVALVNMA